MKTALFWFRNDLRIHDNEAFAQALKEGDTVIALYCFDPRHYDELPSGFPKTGKFRAKFLIESIVNLKNNLQEYSIELLVYQDKPESVIKSLVEKFQIESIYFQKEWTQEEKDVENAVRDSLTDDVKFHSFYGQFLFHPEDILLNIEKLPRVFTDFRKKVEKYSSVRELIQIDNKSIQNKSIENTTKIPTLQELGFKDFSIPEQSAFPFKGGEDSGLKRLHDYLFKSNNIARYKETRNGLLGKDYSSKFSAWLANGSLSPRKIYWEVKRFEKEHTKNDSTYWMIFELIWRDYFKYVSLKYGNKIFQLNGILGKEREWKTDSKAINNWVNGKTGDDFVDANMIEFKKTGFMSNRGRQNVASYFAKQLKIDWRKGAEYFESQLIDYDVHSNYGNWMYVAGVGNDPRDRMFNTQSQADRYDPNKEYRNTWLNE